MLVIDSSACSSHIISGLVMDLLIAATTPHAIACSPFLQGLCQTRSYPSYPTMVLHSWLCTDCSSVTGVFIQL